MIIGRNQKKEICYGCGGTGLWCRTKDEPLLSCPICLGTGKIKEFKKEINLPDYQRKNTTKKKKNLHDLRHKIARSD